MKSFRDAIIKREQAAYLDSLLPPRTDVVAEMDAYAIRHNVPISDPEVALFLEITARGMKAQRALEVGTAIGYGALFLARAMGPEGQVVTIELSEERIQTAHDFLTRAGARERVRIEQGFALEVLPRLNESYDLVYLDAVKEEYPAYLEHATRLLRVGGVLLADNVLWKGQVAGELLHEGERASTEALREFNRLLVSHPQFVAQVLPFGDGLGYGVKIR